MAAGLPWRIFLASISNWTWLQYQWNSAQSLWNATWADIYAGQSSYSIQDDSGWLMDEAMELTGPALLYIENLNGKAQVGWTLIGPCQKHTLKHYWEAWNNTWAAVLTGILWVYGSHGWPYLPRNWTGHCTWGWLYLPVQVQKTLMIQLVNWEAFKARHQVQHTP